MIKKPDYNSSLRKDYWRLDEAVALMLRIHPDHIRALENYRDKPKYDKFKEMLEIAINCSEGTSLQVRGSTYQPYPPELYDTVYAEVIPATFAQWAQTKGYDIPKELSYLLDSERPEPEDSLDENVQTLQSLSDSRSEISPEKAPKIIERRLSVINKAILDFGYDPLEIPTGGKKQILRACLKEPKLFTEPTFKDAWKAARRKGMVKMSEHDKFTPS